ncbi:MAG TPA: AAA family ATPase [Kofleriaceae bacterium]|jgi:energy-coupling factor transporter ATP-binding protein EcfA2|nr:AAA family ATPase [Kofleriaceae bacterium]
MYVLAVEIENIRALDHIRWAIKPDQAPGWHVILGENGAGKSTFLRSIALALVGPSEAPGLRQDWNTWLKRGASGGSISLMLDFDVKRDRFAGQGRAPKNYYLPASVIFDRAPEVTLRASRNPKLSPERHTWGGAHGWFAASYGPFRRFQGGNPDIEKLYHSQPRLARHLSVFGENVSLSEPLAWLTRLDHERQRRNKVSGQLLENITRFVNQPSFLPNGVRLHRITDQGVEFRDGGGSVVLVEELSDGYRSLLSMTFELLRQLVQCYGPKHVFNAKDPALISAPGVVLIDEVDAHLHPSWQREIGRWMRKHFPKIQFIVTTHSPLICQAAHVGTVWRLPRPGSDDTGHMLEGTQLDRVIYGDPVEAYESSAFDLHVLRSDEATQLLDELTKLNQLELKRTLSKAQRKRQQQLRAKFPTAANAMS